MGLSPPRPSAHEISKARILEWAAISFSRGSSQSRDQTYLSCIVGGFFTTGLPGKPIIKTTVDQSLSHVQLFATPWAAACQDSLSFTDSWSLFKLMSIELVMPSNHLILGHPFLLLPQSFPASGSFPVSQFFTSSAQSIGASASASVLPMNNEDRFPLGWTGWISLQSKGLSRVFSSTTVQKHQFFGVQLSL